MAHQYTVMVSQKYRTSSIDEIYHFTTSRRSYRINELLDMKNPLKKVITENATCGAHDPLRAMGEGRRSTAICPGQGVGGSNGSFPWEQSSQGALLRAPPGRSRGCTGGPRSRGCRTRGKRRPSGPFPSPAPRVRNLVPGGKWKGRPNARAFSLTLIGGLQNWHRSHTIAKQVPGGKGQIIASDFHRK